MSLSLLTGPGGTLLLPDQSAVLLDRRDGGNLVVLPPRPVWDRSELDREELVQWSFLVAASGRAMLDVLPQLNGGIINYWEAGNWALNDEAPPAGPKRGIEHKRVHLHLLGRSPGSLNPASRWGESPVFPRYADRPSWSASFELLRPDECTAIVARAGQLLTSKYGVNPADLNPSP
jgi:hypothetical protein